MGRSATIKSDGEAHVSPLGTRSLSEWGGYVRGDLVRITGRSGTWTFWEYTSNDLGNEWVTVHRANVGFVSAFPEQIKGAS